MNHLLEQFDFRVSPSIKDTQRSLFKLDSNHLTTFNHGELVPILLKEVLPGDTFELSQSFVSRVTSSFVKPVMDNAWIEFGYFWIPARILQDNYTKMWGESSDFNSDWVSDPTVQIPTITSPANTGWAKGTIADHFGIPTGIPGIPVNALPFRANALVYSEFFRDQNTQKSPIIYLGDTNVTGTNGSTLDDIAKGGMCPRVNKFHDLFTSVLPKTQKGAPVSINLTSDIPVVTKTATHDRADSSALHFLTQQGLSFPSGRYLSADANGYANYASTGGLSLSGGITPNNLWADTAALTLFEVNSLRYGIAAQQFKEALARGGTRYVEILSNIYGVQAPSGTLQRPEYLGGSKHLINVKEVVQTSGSQMEPTQNDSLGNLASYSNTSSYDHEFKKSFVEHGYIIGYAWTRTKQTYQHGLEKLWSRRTREDFFIPQMAHLGEQPILNQEIFLSSNDTQNKQTFGFQEKDIHYRIGTSTISGAFRSNYAQSLDIYHFGERFLTLPVLNEAFMKEPINAFNRSLTVNSTVEDNFLLDIIFEINATRPIPVRAIPGLDRV